MIEWDSRPPAPSAAKGNRRFYLLEKNIKSKTIIKIKYLQLLKKKNQIFTFQENSLSSFIKSSLDKELQWVNVKQKPFRQI